MAIAYAASGTGTFAGPGTTGSFAANVGAGSDRMLWVGIVNDYDGTNVLTALTYNGVSMLGNLAQARKLNTSTQWIGLYYLINPASGSNTLSCSWTGSSYTYGVWASYTGVPSSTYAVGSTTASTDETDGSLALTMTTNYDNAWTISFVRSTTHGDHSAGSGTTERAQLAGSIGDSNGVITPAQSYTMNWNCVPATGNIGGVMANFVDAVSTPTNSGFFNFM